MQPPRNAQFTATHSNHDSTGAAPQCNALATAKISPLLLQLEVCHHRFVVTRVPAIRTLVIYHTIRQGLEAMVDEDVVLQNNLASAAALEKECVVEAGGAPGMHEHVHIATLLVLFSGLSAKQHNNPIDEQTGRSL